MKYFIKNIIKEELSNREKKILLPLLKSKNFGKDDFKQIFSFLGEYGYSTEEIRNLYLIYLLDGYEYDDSLTLDELNLIYMESYIQEYYGEIDMGFDEEDFWFYNENKSLIFGMDKEYRQMTVPFNLLDDLRLILFLS